MFGSRNLEDLFAILAQEQNDNPWAAETLKTLQRNSPLSLRVIWEQIRRAKSQDLKEALKADFRTMHR